MTDAMNIDPTAVPEPVVAQPQESFHDTASLQAALQANQPTPQGAPLNPYAVEILTKLKDAVAASQQWLKHMETELAKIDQFQR